MDVEEALASKKACIIIYDENFKKIGEHCLPRGRYDLKNVFVDENGIWVSANPRFSKNPIEDKFIFHNYKII